MLKNFSKVLAWKLPEMAWIQNQDKQITLIKKKKEIGCIFMNLFQI